MYLDLINKLRNDSVGQFDEGPGRWVYPLGVIIELNPAACSPGEIAEVRDGLWEELKKNRRTIELRLVSNDPLAGEVAVTLDTQLPENQSFHIRPQTLAEVFANELRRKRFLAGDRLVRRVLVKFHKATCEKITGRLVADSLFQTVLEKYSHDHTLYRIEEEALPSDRGYSISDPEETPITPPDKVDGFNVAPTGIHNSTKVIVHLDIHSLRFSTIKGVALLPGQTLRVGQELDLAAVNRQIVSSTPQTSGDLICDVALPESEFDLLPRRNIVFTPLSLPFRPRPKTLLFSSEQEKYKLLYIGARMRPLRTEIYVSDLFASNFDSPMVMTVGYTRADGAQWYAFNQPCDLMVSDSTTSFRILPGYLFRADDDQFQIRNLHLAFRSPQLDKSPKAPARREVLMESSEGETLIMVQKPEPVLLVAFSEYEIPDLRLGQYRLQLRIVGSSSRASSFPEISSTWKEAAQEINGIQAIETREAILKVQEGPGLTSKPWRSIELDEPFFVGNHILKVSGN